MLMGNLIHINRSRHLYYFSEKCNCDTTLMIKLDKLCIPDEKKIKTSEHSDYDVLCQTS